jgi:hypothetical protein
MLQGGMIVELPDHYIAVFPYMQGYRVVDSIAWRAGGPASVRYCWNDEALGRFLDDQTVVAALQVVAALVAQNYKLKDGRAQDPAAVELYIRTEVHTAEGVMQDTQNRGAHLRMVDPLQPGKPWPSWRKGRRGRGCSRRSGAGVVRGLRGCGWLAAAGWVGAWCELVCAREKSPHRNRKKNIFFQM